MQLAKRFVKAGVSDIVLIAIIIMSIFPVHLYVHDVL